MRKYILVILAILFLSLIKTKTNAQSVGIGTSTFIPDSKSILDIRASAMGLLIPRMAWANRPTGLAPAQDGLIIYCTDGDGTNGTGFYYYDGAAAAWKKLFGGTTTGDYIKNQTSLQSGANFNISGNGYIGGNVGIGTTSPAANIDNGGVSAAGALRTVFARQGEGNSNGSGTFLGVRAWETQTSTYNGKMFSIENTFYGLLNSSIEFYRGGGTIGGFMTFTTNDGTERVRINAAGNVGVGTTSPGQKLDVSGNINSAHLLQGAQLARPYAMWSATGNSTGAVIIKLPGTVTNYGMVHMQIDVYEYASTGVTTYIIGGHNWNSNWYNFNCHTIGTSTKKIRLAVKDGQYAVVIGEQGSTWSYGHVVLSKITNGGYYAGTMDLGGIYTVTQDNNAESYTMITADLNKTMVEGNGTVNYIAKFTSSSLLGNSGIFDDGTNVGIGTTSPADKLSVYNRFLVSHDGVVKWGSAADYGYLSWDADRAIIGGQTGKSLALHTNGAERLRVDASGNVGIGINSPNNFLQVHGASGVRISDPSSAYNANLIFGAPGNGWNSGVRVFDNNDAELRIWHSNVNGQIVLATGYNGDQATTMPTDGLFIDHNIVGIGYASPAAATGKLVVNGNVGIGTTTPAAPLNIYSTPTTGFVEQLRIGGTGNYASLTMGTLGAYDGYISSFGNDLHILAGKGVASEPHNIHFYTSFNGSGGAAENNQRMLIRSDGNVGIGTATPNTKLDVAGDIFSTSGIDHTIKTSAELQNNTSMRGGIYQNGGDGLLNPAGSTALSGWWHVINMHHQHNNGYNAQLAVPLSSSSSDIYLRNASGGTWTEWRKVLSENTSGNVGIGTTTPSDRLQVDGDVNITNGGIKGCTYYSQSEAESSTFSTTFQTKASLTLPAGTYILTFSCELTHGYFIDGTTYRFYNSTTAAVYGQGWNYNRAGTAGYAPYTLNKVVTLTGSNIIVLQYAAFNTSYYSYIKNASITAIRID